MEAWQQEISRAALQVAVDCAVAADRLDRIIARHLPTESRRAAPDTVARLFCPECETWQDADHCATDITAGIPFKTYVCFGCDSDIVTAEVEDEITAVAYVALCDANPAAAALWRITRDGTYVPVAAERRVA